MKTEASSGLLSDVSHEAKTASGIFLPDSAKQDPNWAKVLALGPGRLSKELQIMWKLKAWATRRGSCCR